MLVHDLACELVHIVTHFDRHESSCSKFVLAIVRTLYTFNDHLGRRFLRMFVVCVELTLTTCTPLRALVISSAQMDNHRGSVDTVSIASSFMSAADATSMGMRDPSFDLGGMRAAFKTNSSFV